MVPISLVVSLEIIKFIQAFFVNWDTDMFVDEVGKGAQFKSTSINEELGMVDYIFTDKTGTLTRNIMEFKAFLVGNELYGHLEEELVRRQSTVQEKISEIQFTFTSKKLDDLKMNKN